MRPKQQNPAPEKAKSCFFCVHAINDIDYKDLRLVQRFTSSYAKIVPRRRSGTCVKHQRMVSQAIKRARIMALVPFTVR